MTLIGAAYKEGKEAISYGHVEDTGASEAVAAGKSVYRPSRYSQPGTNL